MGSLVAKTEEASQKHGGQRVALMESLHAVKRAELEAVSKYRTLEDELLAEKLKIARYEDRSVPLPPLSGVAHGDESVAELGEFGDSDGDLKPAAAATPSAASVYPAMVSTPAPATSFVAALQAKMDAVVEAEGSHSSDDSFGLCVDENHGGSGSGDGARFEDDESPQHSIHDSSGRQRVMYLQPAKSGAPLHAGLNTDVWRRGVYDPSSSSVRLDDGATTTTDWARLSSYAGSVAEGERASQQHLSDVARRTTGELAGVAGLRGIIKPVPVSAYYAVANGHSALAFSTCIVRSIGLSSCRRLSGRCVHGLLDRG